MKRVVEWRWPARHARSRVRTRRAVASGWLLAEAIIGAVVTFVALATGLACLAAARVPTCPGPASALPAIEAIRLRIMTARQILYPRATDGEYRASCLILEGPEGEIVAVRQCKRGIESQILVPSRTERPAGPIDRMRIDGATGLVVTAIGSCHVVVRMLIQLPHHAVLTSALALADGSDGHGERNGGV